MLRKNLLQLLFSGACLWRWNDKLRPTELSEIEKQAHKMLAACVLWHESAISLDDEAGTSLAGRIIEGALFDYFYRLIITDIKPPVFYKIKQNPGHYKRLTEYALKTLEPVLSPLEGFWKRLVDWHLSPPDARGIEDRILSASHLYASQWEFNLIRPLNPFDEEMDTIACSFDKGLSEFQDLPGIANLLDKKHPLGKLASLFGQLRFQIRWTQTPRMPATTVLGHMFMVGAIAYLYSVSLGACQQRANNSFFSGIFHDFPEVLTRDIISPVKKSYPELSQLIKDYETEELERRVLGPLKKAGMKSLVSRIGRYLGLGLTSEFQDSITEHGKIVPVKNYAELCQYNRNPYDPRDGQLLKTCDLLAAFLEAYNSIKNGSAATQLVEGKSRLKRELSSQAPDILRIEALLTDFD